MATTTKGSDTREHILDVAQRSVMARGFAATSLDDILKDAGLTKGAFFHHFRSKADLASALIHRFAEIDIAAFEKMSERADALTEDPLQAAIIFIKLFEDELRSLPEPYPGCMLASYLYESGQFEEAVQDYIGESFQRWSHYFEEKFRDVMKVRKPKIDVTARELAEMALSIYEGSFILSRAYHQPDIIIRQSELFRQHLGLVFAD